MSDLKQQKTLFGASIPFIFEPKITEGYLTQEQRQTARPGAKDLPGVTVAKAEPAEVTADAPKAETPVSQKTADNRQRNDGAANDKPDVTRPAANGPLFDPQAQPKIQPLNPAGIAAGALSMYQRQQAQPPHDSTNKPSAVDPSTPFKVGLASTGSAASIERMNKRMLDESFEEQREMDNDGQDILDIYYQQTFNTHMDRMVAFLDRQIEGKRREAEQLEQQIDQLREQRERLQEEHDTLGEERDRVEQQRQETERREQETQAEIDRTKQEIEDQKRKKAEADAAAEKARRDKEELERASDDAKKKEEEAKVEAENEGMMQSFSQEDVRMMQRSLGQMQERQDKLKEQIAAAEKKPLLDDKGRTVHKDESGKYYALDDKGNKTEYTAEEQDALKKKQEAEGLSTPEDIQKLQEEEKRNQAHIDRINNDMEEARRQAHEAGERQRQHSERAEHYKRTRERLTTEVGTLGKTTMELDARSDKLQMEIDEQQRKLEQLQEQQRRNQIDKAEYARQKAEIERQMALKKAEMDKVDRDLKTAETRLETVKQDIKTMEELKTKFKDPKFRERLNSDDPAVKETARQEVEQMRSRLSPELRKEFDDYRARSQKQMKAENTASAPKTTAPQSSAPQSETATATVTTAAPAKTAANTRYLGSAAESGITAQAKLGTEFGSAANGQSQVTPDDLPTVAANATLAANSAQYQQRAAGPSIA